MSPPSVEVVASFAISPGKTTISQIFSARGPELSQSSMSEPEEVPDERDY